MLPERRLTLQAGNDPMARRPRPAPKPIPALMTIREACETLGISRWTLYRRRDSGRIFFVYPNRRPMVRRRDIEAMLADQPIDEAV